MKIPWLNSQLATRSPLDQVRLAPLAAWPCFDGGACVNDGYKTAATTTTLQNCPFMCENTLVIQSQGPLTASNIQQQCGFSSASSGLPVVFLQRQALQDVVNQVVGVYDPSTQQYATLPVSRTSQAPLALLNRLAAPPPPPQQANSPVAPASSPPASPPLSAAAWTAIVGGGVVVVLVVGLAVWRWPRQSR